MFKACIVSAFLFMFMSVAHSLTWYYDFGLSNAEYSIASSESWSFLPPAQAGISKIKLGDAGGYIRLQNPGLGSLGINSELQIAASASGNNNKFSLYNYPGSGLFYTSFDILFGDNSGAGTVSQGTFYFSQGNGDSFTNNGGFVVAEMFSGLQWVFGSNGFLTLKYRNGSTWSVLGASNVFQGILYSVELYGNNSGTNTTYYRGGNAYVLAYNKQDIWINGTRIGGLSKGGIAGGSNIDSFMFYGEVSSNNSAICYLDNIVYANSLPTAASTEPNINLSATILTGFNYREGEGASAAQVFSISGANLSGSASVNAPQNYEISLNQFSGYAVQLSLAETNGTISTTSIYVRLKSGLSSGFYNNESITVSAEGAVSKSVNCSGYVSPAANPAIVLEENFLFDPGTQLKLCGWFAHSASGTNPPVVSLGGLAYPDYPSQSGNAAKTLGNGEDVNLPFSAQNSGNLYCSFLLQVNSAGTSADYIFHLSTTPVGSDYKAKLFVSRDVSNRVRLGITKSTNYDNNPVQIAWTDYQYQLDTIYLVVLKYSIVPGTANDEVYVWINPIIGETEPSPTLSALISETDIGAGGLAAICIRQNSASIRCTFDGFRLANSWLDLLPDPSITLPVGLSSFSALQNSQNNVNIAWITQTETNVLGFYVMRNKTDNLLEAYLISNLINANNTSTEHQYDYQDSDVEDSEMYYYWLQSVDLCGYSSFYGPVSVKIENSEQGGEDPELIPVTNITSVFPNPFNPVTNISYFLTDTARVSFCIYNSRGQLVYEFQEGTKPAGTWNAHWQGVDMRGRIAPSGIYFIVMHADKAHYVKKALLVK